MNYISAGQLNSPSRLGDDHLGAQLVELVPQRLHLQLHLRPHQTRVQRLLGRGRGRRRLRLRCAALGVAAVGARVRLVALARLAVVR